ASLNMHIGNPLDSLISPDSVNRDARGKMLAHLENIAVLDPAVGDGVFLKAAAEWLERTRRSLGDDSPVEAMKSDIVKRNLFGVDVRQEAVSACSAALASWTQVKNTEHLKREIQSKNIKQGNSLIGLTNVPKSCDSMDLKCFDAAWREKLNSSNRDIPSDLLPFHWSIEFHEIMGKGPGFDVLIGNPPYGNILSKTERSIISRTRINDVSSSRKGTWNIAALFIARSRELLRPNSQVGFLIPNSVLRTKQFFRVRRFLLDEMSLWKIVDEASPFEGVTLEMVSIFCKAGNGDNHHSVKVESRRPDIEWEGDVPLQILESSGVFPIYYDAIMARILNRTTKGWATARRGRDLAKSHVSKNQNQRFKVPYATSGRSVKRFHLDSRYLLFADDSFREDSGLRESHENKLLVATKNYPYPRCVMKPTGMIHGGGVVEIIPLRQDIQLDALGLILNSNLVRYMCIKYLTNYSQLTTCLNTGIMEELPLMMPKDQTIFRLLFRSLQDLHQSTNDQEQSDIIDSLEQIANALVYEMYLTDSNALLKATSEAISGLQKPIASTELVMALSDEKVLQSVKGIMEHQMVRQIEVSPRMQT
ncbi:MAG: Eco57I restriction-modification methylase domain-containing protein, partial [Candidatus Thorarchaeota archaeon]